MYRKICEFWSYFCDNHDKIKRESFFNDDLIVIEELHNILKSINSSLCFEFDHPEGKNKQFFLSADGIGDVFKAVDHIYHYKPKIEQWDFIKYRQPINLSEEFFMRLDLQNSVSEIKFSEILFTLEKHASRGIIVNFFIPGYQKGNELHERASWIMLDQCIGEYSAVKRIALYNAFPINKAPQEAKGILTLKNNLDSLRLEYIKDFWSFFSENNAVIPYQDKESHLIDQLQDKLFSINHDLNCVIFAKNEENSGKSVLELTSEGVEEAFEDIELLDQYKPEIKGWNLYKYRKPYQNFVRDELSDISFSLLGLNNDKCTVMFFIPEFSENDSDEDFYKFRELAWIILRATLGEYYATKRFLYQCHPLQQLEPYQFGDKKLKSILHLERELVKMVH